LEAWFKHLVNQFSPKSIWQCSIHKLSKSYLKTLWNFEKENKFKFSSLKIEIESRFGYDIWGKSNINIPCVNQKRNGVYKKFQKSQKIKLQCWLVVLGHDDLWFMNIMWITLVQVTWTWTFQVYHCRLKNLPKLVRNINNVDC